MLASPALNRFRDEDRLVFVVSCVIDLTLLVYFCAGFRPIATIKECADAADAARPFNDDAVRSTIARGRNLVTESADG